MADIVRLELRLPRELVLRIDDWRRRQIEIPNRQKAAQTLLELGIDTALRPVEQPPEKPPPKGKPKP